MESHYERIQDWLITYIANRLDMEPDDIRATIPFSRYGLDSASTIVMTSDLIEWLGHQVEPDTIYQYPTVQALARYLAETLFAEQSHA